MVKTSYDKLVKILAKLRMCRNIASDKSAHNYLISYKIIIKLNMFKTNTKHRINGHVKSASIVTK